MKKFTLFLGVAALVGMSAAAQYTVDPSTSVTLKNNPKWVDYIVLSDDAIGELEKANVTVTSFAPDGQTRNLWIWEQTMDGYDGFVLGVDEAEGKFPQLEVGNKGWSGAGYACELSFKPEDSNETFTSDGLDLSQYGDDTHFHFAYLTPSGSGPASLALIICDGRVGEKVVDDKGNDITPKERLSAPAKFAVGTAFDDNGAIYPMVGPALTDDWQGVDITLGDLKKIYPAFDLNAGEKWNGNILSFLAGGVEGKTFALDAVYFYGAGEAGIADATIEEGIDFVVTGKTINVMGGNGIEVYNMAGQKVKSTEGTTVGMDNLQGGVYVARCGNKVQKVIVR